MTDPRAPEPSPAVTRLLAEAGDGDQEAAAEVYEQLYTHLRALAGNVFQELGGTLQPTVLIHEAWVKLSGNEGGFHDRQHFLATAGLAMRQVLADHVRARRRLKRGGHQQPVTLSDADVGGSADPLDVVEVDAALTELAELHPRHAQVVSMRIFAGMTIREVGEALGVSHGTVESDWSMARAWLRRRLR